MLRGNGKNTGLTVGWRNSELIGRVSLRKTPTGAAAQQDVHVFEGVRGNALDRAGCFNTVEIDVGIAVGADRNRDRIPWSVAGRIPAPIKAEIDTERRLGRLHSDSSPRIDIKDLGRSRKGHHSAEQKGRREEDTHGQLLNQSALILEKGRAL